MIKTSISPRGGRLLAASAVAVPLTGSTVETALATITIPAGAMGLSGAVEVRASLSNNNSANTKAIRIRFGGLAGTVYFTTSVSTSVSLEAARRIRNRSSASSQVGSASSTATAPGSSSGALVTSTVDTSADASLVISGQLSNAADSVTLEGYEVWLLP